MRLQCGEEISLACGYLAECPLFNTTLRQPAMRVWRELYCDSNVGFSHCVRLQLFLKGTMPDDDVLPNGQRVAEVTGDAGSKGDPVLR
jgi:hypothetical protein